MTAINRVTPGRRGRRQDDLQQLSYSRHMLAASLEPNVNLPRHRTVLQNELRHVKRDVDPVLPIQGLVEPRHFETRSNSAPNRSSRTRGFREAKR
jgi:hypothetical protein